MIVRMFCDEAPGSDDGRSQATLHVAGTAAIDAAVPDHAGERIHRPVLTGGNDIRVRIEMHAVTGRAALMTRNEIPAWVAVAVTQCTFGAYPLDGEACGPQPVIQQVAYSRIAITRRVDGGQADQLAGQLDQLCLSVSDPQVEG